MLRTNILIILPRRNVIAYLVMKVVKKVVGERDQRTAKSSPRLTARLNARREDALDQSPENAVIWYVFC